VLYKQVLTVPCVLQAALEKIRKIIEQHGGSVS
jgi:hypothetical protein